MPRSRLLAVLACLSIAACATSRAADRSDERVYVSNEDSGTVSVLDAGAEKLLGNIAVGKRPRGIRISPDGKLLYVALSGSPKGGPNVDESQLPPADRRADGIGVVDVAARRLLRVLPSGADPESFDVVGHSLFVSNEDAAKASIIDLGSGALKASIPVGAEPEGVAARPDEKVVYVTSEAEGAVHVLDPYALRELQRIQVGARPRGIAFTPDGSRAYVTNELGASVSVIDARAHRLERTVPLPAPSGGGALKPMGIVVAKDGEHAYVTTGRAGSVLELELRGGTVSRTLTQVGARPWGIAITGDGRRLFVANGPSNDVAVIDLSSWKVTKRIPVERSPWGVVIGSSSSR